MRGRVIVCGSLVRVVNTVLALVQATHRLTFEKTSSWRVVICAYNESRHTYSVSKTSLGVAMARCGERMRTDPDYTDLHTIIREASAGDKSSIC